MGRVVGLLSLAIALTIFQLTQTSTGRNAAMALLQDALEGAIDGQVRIGPVLGGNLLTRTVLESFEIADADGRRFVALDTVTIEYDPLALLGRQVRVRRLEAARADIRLINGVDGKWNFERIFAGGGDPHKLTAADSVAVDPEAGHETAGAVGDAAAAGADSLAPTESPRNPFRLVFNDATVRDGTIEVRVPWTEGESGPERDRALAEARAGETIWHVERTGAGEYERVYRVERLHGGFPSIRLIDPPRPLRIELEDVGGTLRAVRLPLEVETFSGAVTFGDSVRVDLDGMSTLASSLSGEGWIAGGSPLEFAFDVRAEPLSFADVQWLPVPVPASGGGPMDLRLASRGATAVVTVGDAAVRSEDTRLSGGFGIALESPPRFEALDLSLDHVRIGWVDRLLDREGLIDGTIHGRVSGTGRIDDLDIAADLTLDDLEGESASSIVLARGRVSLVEPYPISGVELDLTGFEPRWMRLLGVEPPIGGRVDGQLTVDRPTGGALGFGGYATYMAPTGEISNLSGAGTVDLAEGSVVDVAIDAQPLALAAIRPWTRDVELVGEVRGPIRARGALSDLLADADLDTPRGHLVFNGRFGLGSDVPTYDAQVEAYDIALDQWIERAPSSRLAVRGTISGRGVDPATLDADFDLEVLSSEVERAEIETSRVRFHIADGLAEIDTLVLNADVGSLSGRGGFGLADDRFGTLEFEAEIADLSEWNRWFAEEIPGGTEAEAGELLFEDFEAAMAGPDPDQPVEGLIGSARANGVVVGTLGDFSVEAFVEAAGARFEGWGADSLSARIQLADPPATDAINAHLVAVGAWIDGQPLDSLELGVERSEPGPAQVDFHARRDSTIEISGRGEVSTGGGAFAASLERLRMRLGKIESALVDPARIAYSDSALVLEGVVLTGPLGRLEANGHIPAAGGAGSLDIELFGIRVDQLGYLLSAAPEVGGTLSGSGTVTGTLSEPAFRGTVRILDPSVREHRYTTLDALFEYSDRRLGGSIDLTRDGFRLARLEGSVRADLALGPVERRLLDEPLDLRVRADSLPMQLLELRLRGVEDIDGQGRGTVTLTGAPGDLRYGGSLEVSGGSGWVPDLGIRLLDVGVTLEFEGSDARIAGTLRSGAGGDAVVQGSLDVSRLSDPDLDLELTAERFHAAARRDMSLAIDGRGHLGGRYRDPELTGDFRLRGGDIFRDEFLRAQGIIDLSDPMFYALLDSAAVADRRLLERFRNDFMDNLRFVGTIDLGPNLWLRSPELDVEMVAEDLQVTMDRELDQLVMRGDIDLPRGTYRFDRFPPYVQSLRITSGAIRFPGNPDFNPNLDITAQYRNRTAEGPVLVEARIGGTLQQTELALTSNPPMSESDKVCFLAVGAPCVAAADQQLGQRLLQEYALGTLTSGISSALVGSTGLSYFNLRSVGGASASGVQAQQSLFDQTQLEFGWYAGEEVFFSFSQPLGGGAPSATLEWRFTNNWTLEARAASRYDERLFGLVRGTNLSNDRTFGLFLFREWVF